MQFRILFEDANEHFKAQNYQAAKNLFIKVINSNTKLEHPSEVYKSLTECCLILGDVEGAEQAIEKLHEFGCSLSTFNAFEKQLESLRNLSKKIVDCFESNTFVLAGNTSLHRIFNRVLFEIFFL